MPSLPATVSPLELAWTIVALVGVCIATLNCIDAIGDVRLQRASGRNGSFKITAEGEFSDQRLILICLVCKLLMGVFAMFALPGREPDGDLSWSTIFIPVLMIIVCVSLVLLSISKKIRRRKLDEYLAAENAQEEAELAAQARERHTELTGSLSALHEEVSVNTALTERAADRADAAYAEANHVSSKVERVSEATVADAERRLDELNATGEDTNARVRKVESRIVQTTTTETTTESDADASDT